MRRSAAPSRPREFTLPGFRHDFGAMNLSLFAGSAFHRKYANELKAHGLEFAPVADCFASAFPDGRWFGVSNRPRKDRRAHRRLLRRRCRNMAPAGRGLPGGGRASVPAAGLADERSRRLPAPPGTCGARRASPARSTPARLLLSSPRAWLDENFRVAACQGDARRLGHASRFRARHRRRRGVSLSGIDGQPEFRHGARQGRRRHHDPRAGGHGRRGRRQDLHRRRGGRDHGVRRQGDRRPARFRRNASRPAKAVIAGVAPGALPGKLLPQRLRRRRLRHGDEKSSAMRRAR